MLKKQYQAGHETCKVTFTIDHAVAHDAQAVSVVGDFNDWDVTANPMKRRSDGSFDAMIKLSRGESYQFRYLIDGSIWENDAEADGYVPTPFGDCDNSVVGMHAVCNQ